MPDFDDPAFDTAVLEAAECGGPAAACETVLAADDFPGAVRRLRMLPADLRRQMAGACVELYRAAGPSARRDRLRTAHAGLLGRRIDLLDSDGFEAAALASMHLGSSATDDKRAVLETALASGEVPRMADRLRTFDSEYRRRLTEFVLGRMWETAAEPERREGVLWLHTALAPQPLLLGAPASEAALREAAGPGAPAEAAEVVAEDTPLPVKVRRLADLPRDVRHALDRHCAELLAAASTQERRESLLWVRALVSARPLEQLGYDHLEPLLRAAAEHGDAETACEALLADSAFSGTAEKAAQLPAEVLLPLVESCADLYPRVPEARRPDLLRLHAQLSLPLDRPDDRLAAPRQEALARADPADLRDLLIHRNLAWLELASGRTIPRGSAPGSGTSATAPTPSTPTRCAGSRACSPSATRRSTRASRGPTSPSPTSPVCRPPGRSWSGTRPRPPRRGPTAPGRSGRGPCWPRSTNGSSASAPWPGWPWWAAAACPASRTTTTTSRPAAWCGCCRSRPPTPARRAGWARCWSGRCTGCRAWGRACPSSPGPAPTRSARWRARPRSPSWPGSPPG
ncbi:hypothetical protein HNR12_002753 [Streptomonospora nanhaiensis]|uniref:Uncharacterized protein n=1 Tax=Streptomonospora nanhaiensis TaxID=1323731 RepID=A0A853BPA2_9ACTN|nr:hypothetical protein [Streptomonospora nanhaiensis]NYI96476.1 hypothetical protein [Streptomonospora nanhaiensis]